MIAIIDYGMGNLGSISNMLKKLGYEAAITSDAGLIGKAEKIILPGVGAFDNGINQLRERQLLDVLDRKAMHERVPILGICLGMQLMTKSSEEGTLHGLGWIDAETIRFRTDRVSEKIRIPHMGWNTVAIKKGSSLFDEQSGEMRFYFVHSYHAACEDQADILTTTFYGYEFVSSFQRKNIVGVQFHPEKSHKFGMQLLRNFVEAFK